MRLVCPNCGAQYEVDDKVIPDSGRDVQCSNCGHAWYQLPAGHPAEADTDPEVAAGDRIAADEPEENTGEAGDEAAEDAREEVVADAGTGAGDADGDDTDDEETGDEDTGDEDTGDEDSGPAPGATHAPRPLVDDGVRDILKAEAEREMAERAREGRHDPEQVETQPELGIDRGSDPDEDRRRLARERMARMRGIDLEDEPDDYPDPDEAGDTATARRDLFPDIEEINSTLDSRETRPERHDPTPQPARRGGFGRGFLVVVVLTLIAVAVYVFAPQIATRLPAAEPALTAYVETVDKGRLWLEDNVQALIAKLEEMAAPEGDGGGAE